MVREARARLGELNQGLGATRGGGGGERGGGAAMLNSGELTPAKQSEKERGKRDGEVL